MNVIAGQMFAVMVFDPAQPFASVALTPKL
jgi:hypothetical protein